MKALFILQEGPDSGINVYTKSLAKELTKLGVKVNIDKKFEEDYDIIHVHGRPNLKVLQKLLVGKNCYGYYYTHDNRELVD